MYKYRLCNQIIFLFTANEILQGKNEPKRLEEKNQKRATGFVNSQNNNLSFVGIQSFQENSKEGIVKGEQKMFHTTKAFQSRESFGESFTHRKVTSAQRKETSSSMIMKEFEKERMASNETFMQPNNKEVSEILILRTSYRQLAFKSRSKWYFPCD